MWRLNLTVISVESQQWNSRNLKALSEVRDVTGSCRVDRAQSSAHTGLARKGLQQRRVTGMKLRKKSQHKHPKYCFSASSRHDILMVRARRFGESCNVSSAFASKEKALEIIFWPLYSFIWKGRVTREPGGRHAANGLGSAALSHAASYCGRKFWSNPDNLLPPTMWGSNLFRSN